MSRTLTRRQFAGALIAATGCRSNSAPSRERSLQRPVSSSAAPKALDFGGLDVATPSSMPEGERGGTAVVLLHGFGARADDLLPFAQRLMRPRSRFFVPAGPLPQGSEGRAWWYFDERERSLREWDGQVPLAHQPHEQVLRVREALQTLLASVREHYAPERLALAGFSQGGMLTLDVALASEPSVDRAAVLSGAFIAESMEALRRERTSRPSFFLSHGRADRIVPFRAAEGTHSLLTGAGFPVAFEAFEGGHEIPPQVLAKVANFVYG